MKKTIDYYNRQAELFYSETVTADMTAVYRPFLEALIPSAEYILDAGCGSGRDTKFFLEQGFSVDAFDASEALCKLAAAYTQIPVKQMTFQNLKVKNTYDGIWACASLLHLSRKMLPEAISHLRDALKNTGVLYMSFKYGTFEGEKNGRYFTYLTEKTLAQILEEGSGTAIKKCWKTGDVRDGREDEQWLNALIIKCGK